MALYIYQNPKTGETKEIVQSMNEEHSYSENNIQWARVFTKPNSSIDTQINPDSASSFINITKNKNYTIGDLWSKSAELNEKRGGENDPIKQKALKKYKDATKKDHPSLKKTGTFEI
jgi:hypothetical protein